MPAAQNSSIRMNDHSTFHKHFENSNSSFAKASEDVAQQAGKLWGLACNFLKSQKAN